MASISWSGGTLSNRWAGTPASRFRDWAPRSVKAAQVRTLLGSGSRRVWEYRQDRGAVFTLDEIPASAMADMIALVEHLDGGGEVTVTCDDTLGSTYTCTLAPDADLPHPELADAQALRYRMTFALISVDGTPMIAVYG